MDVPLEILDREAARAAAESAAAHAELARGRSLDAPNPLAGHRRVSSRATYLELGERGHGAPLAAPLRAWVAALTLDRVLWPDAARLAAAWHAPSITVAEPGIAAFTASPRALVRRVLAEVDPARRAVFASALARGADPITDAARILAERRVEAARLLGAELDAIEIPVDPKPSLAAVAERLLVETAPLVERRVTWHEALAGAVGRSFAHGWPAHLVPRWLEELFRATGLDEGLRLALGPLPAPLGASSFARALAAFGAAIADADGPGSAPFVLSRAPFDLRRARRAALFGGLVADPVFGARALGLGKGRARDQARGVARALLVSLRLDAVRVLLRGALIDPARGSRCEERTAEALGAPIPPSLAGAVPALGPEDAARFAGALLAARDRRALIDHFDEDWFANPRAARAIREEDGVVPASHVATAAELEVGLAEIVRVLGELG
jgi:hypothetical protein